MQLFEVLIFAPFLGLLAGYLAGLLGIGGGIIIVPTLLLLLPLLPQINQDNIALVAISTSLFTIVTTGFSSAKSHYKKGNIDWCVVIPTVIGVVLCSILASILAGNLGSSILTQLFATLLIVSAIQIYPKKSALSIPKQFSPSFLKLFLGGCITGTIAALTGVGGGTILVSYLVFFGCHIHKAIGTSAASGMMVAVFGSVGYMLSSWQQIDSPYFIGYVHWPTAIMIMIFSYISAPWGVKAGHTMNQSKLKRIFSIFLLFISIKLFSEQICS